MTKNYFAKVARGLEEIAAKELENLGAIDIRTDFTGVHFRGDNALLYRVNLWSRVIFRVLMPIYEVKSYNAEQLYRNVYKLDWEEYLQTQDTFAVVCTGGNKNLNHTYFTALQIKNAIVDRQRKQIGKRSNINIENPDVLINAHIEGDRCLLSLDSSGSSLHRRGYRPAMGIAPLKETLAAALLEIAEWKPNIPFLDPLCGSGILPIEAALKSLNIAPGLYRKQFGFQTWKDFDRALWEKILTEAKERQLSELLAPILGSDRDSDILQQACINAQSCGIEKHIQLTQKDLSEIEAPAKSGMIICNPPYGKRIGDIQELGGFYKLLGDIFKQRFQGWTAYVLTGNKELAKQVGLRASRRIPVYNGSLPCTLLKYELY
ncbi:putative N6-adenine-specific DNA methylase [Pleurocapsa sp. PCC 7327]|uniref:THUMP domain-containing class I SAM-dependent RNA methyltransferase n=1 Tax=Pleurocapsa sp. PCC 7327 TaxID=118163 RepID=UPI00029FBF7C|nr:THUMP domain-containing protein [Pleurocapsa sp. PCC 7327]AFY75829.1 putative N6-adenine-specific DNA methylase [Pleurocapsa sp. PCC 7327]